MNIHFVPQEVRDCCFRFFVRLALLVWLVFLACLRFEKRGAFLRGATAARERRRSEGSRSSVTFAPALVSESCFLLLLFSLWSLTCISLLGLKGGESSQHSRSFARPTILSVENSLSCSARARRLEKGDRLSSVFSGARQQTSHFCLSRMYSAFLQILCLTGKKRKRRGASPPARSVIFCPSLLLFFFPLLFFFFFRTSSCFSPVPLSTRDPLADLRQGACGLLRLPVALLLSSHHSSERNSLAGRILFFPRRDSALFSAQWGWW